MEPRLAPNYQPLTGDRGGAVFLESGYNTQCPGVDSNHNPTKGFLTAGTSRRPGLTLEFITLLAGSATDCSSSAVKVTVSSTPA
jgi:hypothetical protein